MAVTRADVEQVAIAEADRPTRPDTFTEAEQLFARWWADHAVELRTLYGPGAYTVAWRGWLACWKARDVLAEFADQVSD